MTPLGFSNPTPFLCTPQLQRGRVRFRKPTRAGAFPHLRVGGSGSHIRCSHSLCGRCGPLNRDPALSSLSFYTRSFRRAMSLMRYMFSMSPPSSMPRSVVIIYFRPSRETRFRFGVDQVRVSSVVSAGVTHPHLKPTFWPLLSSGSRFGPRHAPPPQAPSCHCRPESALSPKCSPLTSNRGRFAPDSATKSQLRPLRHQTPFPVHPCHCKKPASDWRPSVGPPCVRSFSASRSFTLFCERCDQARRSKRERGE